MSAESEGFDDATGPSLHLLSRAADLLVELELELAAGRASLEAAEERLHGAAERARQSGVFPAYRRVS